MSRISAAFHNRPALMPYLTLGYPDPDGSLACVEAAAAAGADLIELGVPFSDPLADGPTIGLHKINDGQYDLIITDRAMPDMSGDQLALSAKRIAPHVPILMLTGFGDFMIARGEHPVGVDAVVSKPITIEALREAIGDVTAVRLSVP